jgi:hypothetical protein
MRRRRRLDLGCRIAAGKERPERLQLCTDFFNGYSLLPLTLDLFYDPARYRRTKRGLGREKLGCARLAGNLFSGFEE